MIRRSLFLAIFASLAVPSAAQAFFFRPYYYHGYYAPPPVAYWYAPPVYVLPPVYLPAYECAPATPKAPLILKDAPKPMEKPAPRVELPKPKEVLPAAASVKPKVEPAIPRVAVPDAPKPEEKKLGPPEKKKDEKPDVGVPAIPKLNLPLAVPEAAVPKADEKKIPEIKLPPIVSESKYTPRESPDVRVIPLEGKAVAGKRTVSFYNYTDRELSLSVDGQLKTLPAKSSLGLALPDSFKWSVGGPVESTAIPADAAGLSVVIK
jgi:hypothetical protein